MERSERATCPQLVPRGRQRRRAAGPLDRPAGPELPLEHELSDTVSQQTYCGRTGLITAMTAPLRRASADAAPGRRPGRAVSDSTADSGEKPALHLVSGGWALTARKPAAKLGKCGSLTFTRTAVRQKECGERRANKYFLFQGRIVVNPDLSADKTLR